MAATPTFGNPAHSNKNNHSALHNRSLTGQLESTAIPSHRKLKSSRLLFLPDAQPSGFLGSGRAGGSHSALSPWPPFWWKRTGGSLGTSAGVPKLRRESAVSHWSVWERGSYQRLPTSYLAGCDISFLTALPKGFWLYPRCVTGPGFPETMPKAMGGWGAWPICHL